MDQLRPTHLVIHLDRLLKNFKALRKLSQQSSFICPMVKANAYGHGDVAVGKTLTERGGCQFLGVSSVEEAIQLQISEVQGQLLVFNFTGKEAAYEILKNNFTAVVSNFQQLDDLIKQEKSEFRVHLKMNTGMNRLGFRTQDLERLKKEIGKSRFIKLEGFCTHLLSGENIHLDKQSSQNQIGEFKKAIAEFSQPSLYFHAYNSAATARLYLTGRELDFGLRPGLLAYGINPEPDLKMNSLISPVMEYKSKIVAIQEVKSGEVVSYGGTWRADKDSLIGIVPAGYADGISRSLSNRGEFLVMGQRVPIRGLVCMDYTMVDLSNLKGSYNLLGEEVVLIGSQGQDHISVEEFAGHAGRVHYEIVTNISERVPRHYGDWA